MKSNFTFIVAVVGVLISAAKAQRASIGYPLDGMSVTTGSEITVEIDREDTLTGSIEVAVVIGVVPCPTSGCLSADYGLGTVLYNGGYDPEFHPDAPFDKPPHQNFTVTIPPIISKGKVQLGVFHASLIGVSSII
ncbi:hypothetical protein C0989_007844 [Termitomyces sp. Mn162]|nr:hypothetical protein C0989_007844 [Termitomyces sp. Mn162]